MIRTNIRQPVNYPNYPTPWKSKQKCIASNVLALQVQLYRVCV